MHNDKYIVKLEKGIQTLDHGNAQELYALIVQVRICFNRLKSLGELILQDIEINPSMRAVLEALNAKDKQTVPEIARSKSVSRQHIQTIMNALVVGAYVQQLENPAHKRSPWFVLTEKGIATFDNIKKREAEPLQQLADNLDIQDIELTKGTMQRLNQELSKLIEERNKK